MIFIIYNRSIGEKLFSILKKFKINITEEFINSFYSSRIKKRRILFSFLITFLVWLMDGFIFFIILKSLAGDFSLSFIHITSLWAISLLLGLITSLPGGIGGSDVVMIVSLSLLGIESGIAASGVLLARAVSLGYGLFAGYISFLYLSKKMDTKQLKILINSIVS
jgi:hypothetical protein